MSENKAQNLPIRMTDDLIYDNVYSSMKERFVAEMTRIDEEMAKLSSVLRPKDDAQSGTATSKPFNMDLLNDSPLIDGEGGSRTLKLQFDVSQFAPVEVTVSIIDMKLIVSARHEEKSDTSTTTREYRREFHLPPGVDPETVVSSLSKDGVLIVQAPLPAALDKSLAK